MPSSTVVHLQAQALTTALAGLVPGAFVPDEGAGSSAGFCLVARVLSFVFVTLAMKGTTSQTFAFSNFCLAQEWKAPLLPCISSTQIAGQECLFLF